MNKNKIIKEHLEDLINLSLNNFKKLSFLNLLQNTDGVDPGLLNDRVLINEINNL